VSDATISSFSLFRAKAYICMTVTLLLYILQKYYLNESVTVCSRSFLVWLFLRIAGVSYGWFMACVLS